MTVIIFIFMNLLVTGSAWLLTYKLVRLKDTVDSFIAFFLFYSSQVVISQLVLGIFERLYLPNLILLNTAIFLLLWRFCAKIKPFFDLGGIRKAIGGILNNKVILLGISLLFGFGLIKLLINLLNPPFGWDCLNYHFSFPVEWLKRGHFEIMTSIADDPSPPYYPINGSLLFLWLIFPFKNVFLADFGQVPFFILAFLGIFNSCRKLEIRKELCFYAALLFLMVPNVFKQLEIAYVDVMFVALFAAAFNFLITFYRRPDWRYLILFSVTFGFFLGIKTSSIVYGVFPVIFFFAGLLKNFKQLKVKTFVSYLSVFILTSLLLGGYSYIHNFFLTGNALFPAEITALGKVIFPGVMPFSTYRNKWTVPDYNIPKLLFHEGMGGQFLLFVVVVSCFLTPLLFIINRTKTNKGFLPAFLAFLPISLYAAFYAFMPQLWVRYLYPFVAMGFISAFYTLNRLKLSPFIIRAIVAMCFIASAGEFSSKFELVISLASSALFFFLLPGAARKIKISRRGLLLITAISAIALYFINQNYDKYEFRRYLKNTPFPLEEKSAWAWLDKNTAHDKIAFTGSPDTLPLYGTNFKNDIVYASVNPVHPARIHNFPKARYIWSGDFLVLHADLEIKGNYREGPDYSAWLKNLEREKADILFVYAYHQVKQPIFPIENSWAAAHPEKFSLVYNNKRINIYRIQK